VESFHLKQQYGIPKEMLEEDLLAVETAVWTHISAPFKATHNTVS
jgi:hypothetical protein